MALGWLCAGGCNAGELHLDSGLALYGYSSQRKPENSQQLALSYSADQGWQAAAQLYRNQLFASEETGLQLAGQIKRGKLKYTAILGATPRGFFIPRNRQRLAAVWQGFSMVDIGLALRREQYAIATLTGLEATSTFYLDGLDLDASIGYERSSGGNKSLNGRLRLTLLTSAQCNPYFGLSIGQAAFGAANDPHSRELTAGLAYKLRPSLQLAVEAGIEAGPQNYDGQFLGIQLAQRWF